MIVFSLHTSMTLKEALRLESALTVCHRWQYSTMIKIISLFLLISSENDAFISCTLHVSSAFYNTLQETLASLLWAVYNFAPNFWNFQKQGKAKTARARCKRPVYPLIIKPDLRPQWKKTTPNCKQTKLKNHPLGVAPIFIAIYRGVTTRNNQ